MVERELFHLIDYSPRHMPEFRSRLVRAFRAVGNPNKPKSLRIPVRDLIRQTEAEISTIPIDDCHSILVAIAKMLKSSKKSFSLEPNFLTKFSPPHPVVVAPLAAQLVRRILCSDAPFRTVAGTFGLVHRLGIDWSTHLILQERGQFLNFVQSHVPQLLERHVTDGDTSIDMAALGYCCEAVLKLNLFSPEFHRYVEMTVRNSRDPIPPLAVVQISRFLSLCENPDQSVIQILLDQVALYPEKFTAQNLVTVLQSMTAVDCRDPNLLDSICVQIAANVGKMRMTDCVSVVQSVAQLANHDLDNLPCFIRAVQRRCTVLTVTSPTPLPVSVAYTIMSSLNKLGMLTGRPDHIRLQQFNFQTNSLDV